MSPDELEPPASARVEVRAAAGGVRIIESRRVELRYSHDVQETRMDTLTADGLAKIERARAIPVLAIAVPMLLLGAGVAAAILWVIARVIANPTANTFAACVGMVCLAGVGWPVFRAMRPLLDAAVKRLSP